MALTYHLEKKRVRVPLGHLVNELKAGEKVAFLTPIEQGLKKEAQCLLD